MFACWQSALKLSLSFWTPSVGISGPRCVSLIVGIPTAQLDDQLTVRLTRSCASERDLRRRDQQEIDPSACWQPAAKLPCTFWTPC